MERKRDSIILCDNEGPLRWSVRIRQGTRMKEKREVIQKKVRKGVRNKERETRGTQRPSHTTTIIRHKKTDEHASFYLTSPNKCGHNKRSCSSLLHVVQNAVSLSIQICVPYRNWFGSKAGNSQERQK